VSATSEANGASVGTKSMKATRFRPLLFTEYASWVFGLAGLVWWGAFQVGVATSTRHELEHFAALRLVAQEAGEPDQSLWSPARVSAWRKALLEPAPASLAVLRIPKIRLEVPVLPGTDDHTLDRAVGYIEGTAQPGTDGNLGIAGHRDGFFRGLKDVVLGDAMELETRTGTLRFVVDNLTLVGPDDTWVLDDTPSRQVSLVTCYPFYYQGSAPRRYIVQAVEGKAAR
jgi:sortase A